MKIRPDKVCVWIRSSAFFKEKRRKIPVKEKNKEKKKITGKRCFYKAKQILDFLGPWSKNMFFLYKVFSFHASEEYIYGSSRIQVYICLHVESSIV